VGVVGRTRAAGAVVVVLITTQVRATEQSTSDDVD